MKTTAVRSVADVGRGTIVAVVEIAAPPERVFRAISTSEITEWWGSPEMYRTTSFTADLRPGGTWRSDGVGADGKPFHVKGEYLQVEPPRVLVHTWEPEWDPGRTVVHYQLDPVEGGTRLTLRHEGFGDRVRSCEGHAHGWQRVLGWLASHVTAPPVHFLCKLVAPRPTFPHDMSAEERVMMGEHAAYWGGLLADGTAVAYGPVADPAGFWGLGLVRVADAAEAKAITDADPAIRAGRGLRYELLPMAALRLP